MSTAHCPQNKPHNVPNMLPSCFQMLRHSVWPSNQYASHLHPSDVLRQPIRAHCKQSSCGITLWYLSGANSLHRTLLPDLSLDFLKEGINLPVRAPCYFTGEGASDWLQIRDHTSRQGPFCYLSTMRIYFWQDAPVSTTSTISTSIHGPFCKQLSGRAERKGTESHR